MKHFASRGSKIPPLRELGVVMAVGLSVAAVAGTILGLF